MTTNDRPHTVSGLIDLHAEIAGKIETQRQVMNRLVADLEAVEHTVCLLDPTVELAHAKRPPSKDQARKNEMRRHILAALRDATGPLTAAEIARLVVASRGLADDDATLKTIRQRVQMALWKLKARGWAAEIVTEGHKGWARV